MDVAFRPRFEVVSHYTIGPDVAATRRADGLEQIRIPATAESMDQRTRAALESRLGPRWRGPIEPPSPGRETECFPVPERNRRYLFDSAICNDTSGEPR